MTSVFIRVRRLPNDYVWLFARQESTKSDRLSKKRKWVIFSKSQLLYFDGASGFTVKEPVDNTLLSQLPLYHNAKELQILTTGYYKPIAWVTYGLNEHQKVPLLQCCPCNKQTFAHLVDKKFYPCEDFTNMVVACPADDACPFWWCSQCVEANKFVMKCPYHKKQCFETDQERDRREAARTLFEMANMIDLCEK